MCFGFRVFELTKPNFAKKLGNIGKNSVKLFFVNILVLSPFVDPKNYFWIQKIIKSHLLFFFAR